MYEPNGSEQVEVKREPIACGECVTTEYRVDGELVRRDIRIEVSREAMGGLAGQVGSL